MVGGNVEIITNKNEYKVYIDNQTTNKNLISNDWENIVEQNFESDELESLFDVEKHKFKIISSENNFPPIVIRDIIGN